MKSTEDKKGSELCSLSVRWRTSLNHNEHGKAKKAKKTMSLMGTRVDAIRSQSHTKRREMSPTWNRRCIFFSVDYFFSIRALPETLLSKYCLKDIGLFIDTVFLSLEVLSSTDLSYFIILSSTLTEWYGTDTLFTQSLTIFIYGWLFSSLSWARPSERKSREGGLFWKSKFVAK